MGYTSPMCGRYALEAPRSQLSQRFGLDECAGLPVRYNIAPGTDIPVIRQSPNGKRVLHLLHWGLLPHWERPGHRYPLINARGESVAETKDPAIAARLINARGESVAEKPSFRDAFRHRRCLIPASGFYEWKSAATAQEARLKQPCYISLKSGEAMAIGGLWESWTSPAGKLIRSCCIVTTAANELLRPIHERMPLIIAPRDWQDWLAAPADQIAGLIQPCPGDELQVWTVSQPRWQGNRGGSRSDRGGSW
jgi:putative SOS response-associated peptidase YedK